MYDVIRPEQFGGRVIEIRRLWVPQTVWVSLWGWAETPQVDYEGLLHEWEGRGPAGKLVWRAKVSLVVDGPPPAAWNERHPWVRADQVRPRGEAAAGNVPPRDD